MAYFEIQIATSGNQTHTKNQVKRGHISPSLLCKGAKNKCYFLQPPPHTTWVLKNINQKCQAIHTKST